MRNLKSKCQLFAILPALGFVVFGHAASAQASNDPDADFACKDCAQPYAEIPLVPPAHFDPVIASDVQLDAYGFPPRPNQAKAPGAYAIWKMVVTRSTARIVPQLQATKLVNGPVKMLTSGHHPVGAVVGEKSGNWSGYVVTDNTNPFRADKTYIYASFTVPVAQQAFGRCSTSAVHSSAWIGIDGSGSKDVLQAGIRAGATCKSGKTTASYAAWYEWFPEDEIDIKNFDIHPGDLIFVYVWNTSATKAHYYLEDVTTNKASSLSFKAPKDTKLVGNSAEWILERPSIDGKDSTLTNYVNSAWIACHVLLADGTLYSPADVHGGKSESLTMTDDDKDISFADTTPNNALTYMNPSGDTTYWTGTGLWFFDEGSALNK